VKIRDVVKRAILMIEDDILRLLDAVTIARQDDGDFIDRGIRFIVVSSVTILIKVKRDCALLFKGQVGG